MLIEPVKFLKKMKARNVDPRVLINGYEGTNLGEPMRARHALMTGQKLYVNLSRNQESSRHWDISFVYMYASSAEGDERRWALFEDLRPYLFN